MSHVDRQTKREYQRRWLKARRDKWLSENGPCKKCGSDKNLEVDHIDPSTKNPILKGGAGGIWSWAEKRRLEELAKCQVLCHDCHLAKSLEEVDYSHGENWQYRNGCRCEICVAANAKRAKEWRERVNYKSPNQISAELKRLR